jgi:hypothetical protein
MLRIPPPPLLIVFLLRHYADLSRTKLLGSESFLRHKRNLQPEGERDMTGESVGILGYKRFWTSEGNNLSAFNYT